MQVRIQRRSQTQVVDHAVLTFRAVGVEAGLADTRARVAPRTTKSAGVLIVRAELYRFFGAAGRHAHAFNQLLTRGALGWIGPAMSQQEHERSRRHDPQSRHLALVTQSFRFRKRDAIGLDFACTLRVDRALSSA